MSFERCVVCNNCVVFESKMSASSMGGDDEIAADDCATSERRRSGDGRGDAAAAEVFVERPVRVFKIVVIGDTNVGKTCLTFRFCGGKFPAATEATIGVDFRERTVEVDGELVKLQLWDTAGQERYHKGLTNHFYRNLHAVIFVYDVTKRRSFDSLHLWLAEYDRHRPEGAAHVPRILVGNKCDVPVTDIDLQGGRVSTHVAQRFADAHDMPLFETSAKDDDECNHVDAIFMTLAHKLKHSRPMMMWTTTTTTTSKRSSSRRQGQREVNRRSYGGTITVHRDSEQMAELEASSSRSHGSCC